MNKNIALTDELVAFAKAKQEEKLARLRQAFKQGIESGDAGELDLNALKAEGRKSLKLGKFYG